MEIENVIITSKFSLHVKILYNLERLCRSKSLLLQSQITAAFYIITRAICLFLMLPLSSALSPEYILLTVLFKYMLLFLCIIK